MYAEISDLELRWRPLSDEEKLRAQVLLQQGSRLLRLRVAGLDARIVSTALDSELVADVLCAMVARAITNGFGAPRTQRSVSVGGVTTSESFATSPAGLDPQPHELAMLQPAVGVSYTLSLAGPDAAY